MTKPFLLSVAEKVLSRHQNELDEILIVVPGNRAKRFIYNHLKTLMVNKVSWLPSGISFNELVQKLSEIESQDQLDLLLELFDCHQVNNPEEKFEDFLKWGGTALSDFNDIENYLINGTEVYSNLRDFKEIEEWSFAADELSKDQESFLEFWDYLGRLKSDFDKKLVKAKTGYSGLIIREAIKALESKAVKIPWKKIYFIGLNAISEAERRFISLLQEMELAEIISDSDAYYHENKIHEAGYFMRKQEEFFGIKHELSNGWSEQKDISFVRANTAIGMAHIAADKLETYHTETALVLEDENLLMPLLNGINPDLKEANITMGYPLKDGMVWSGLNRIIKLVSAAAKTEKIQVNALDEMAFDSFLVSVIKDTKTWKKTCQDLIQKNRVYINLQEFKELFKDQGVLSSCINSSDAVSLLDELKILCELSYHKFENLTDFIREQIAITHQFLTKFHKKLATNSGLNNLRALDQITDRLVANEKVPFEGEPYEGVQIMGLLEARALDFKHVIFCGATDALMPAVKKDNSFIPFELKIHYGLPTNREKEAVFAYSFYRLCQRAETVQFIYTDTEDALVANEKSRFLNQIEHEWPPYSGGKIRYETNESVMPKGAQIVPAAVPKTKAHLELIEEHLAKGISASAINTFLACPADYYYKYLAKFKEPARTELVVHPSVTGSILHNTLENLYRPYVGKVLSVSALQRIEKSSLAFLDEEIQKRHLTEVFSSGENRLEYMIMKEKLARFLAWEKAELKQLEKANQVLTIESIEGEYSHEIPGLEVNGTQIKLTGFVDRIDRIGSELRVVDYKSGKVVQSDLNLNPDLELTGKTNKGKAVQQLVYGLLVGNAHPEYLEKGFVCGNISLKNISSGYLSLQMKEGKSKAEKLIVNKENWPRIIEALKEVFSEMLNAEQPFFHKEDSDYCDFCIKE